MRYTETYHIKFRHKTTQMKTVVQNAPRDTPLVKMVASVSNDMFIP